MAACFGHNACETHRRWGAGGASEAISRTSGRAFRIVDPRPAGPCMSEDVPPGPAAGRNSEIEAIAAGARRSVGRRSRRWADVRSGVDASALPRVRLDAKLAAPTER